MVAKLSERDSPPTSSSKKMALAGQSCDMNEHAASTAANETLPAHKTVRTENRRKASDVMGRMQNDPSALAKVTSPLAEALYPNPACRVSGTKNGNAPAPARNKLPAIVA